MPRAQYRVPLDQVELTATFATPKLVANMDEWVRAAAVAMPDAEAFRKAKPNQAGVRYQCGQGWYLSDSGATERVVSFEFLHSDGRRAYLVIDRQFGTVGARV